MSSRKANVTKTLQRIKAHPAVSDALTDSDGTWIYLKSGWKPIGCPGEHVIVEDTVIVAARRLRDIESCNCDQCKF